MKDIEFIWESPETDGIIVGIVQFRDSIIIATQRAVYRIDNADDDEHIKISQVEIKP